MLPMVTHTDQTFRKSLAEQVERIHSHEHLWTLLSLCVAVVFNIVWVKVMMMLTGHLPFGVFFTGIYLMAVLPALVMALLHRMSLARLTGYQGPEDVRDDLGEELGVMATRRYALRDICMGFCMATLYLLALLRWDMMATTLLGIIVIFTMMAAFAFAVGLLSTRTDIEDYLMPRR